MSTPISGKLNRDQMAWRVAQNIPGGSYVNLGIGMPEMVANHLPDDRQVIFHCENGILGMGPVAAPGEEDFDLVTAGKKPVTAVAGAAFFDSANSFAMIRGGHLDIAVLGAVQISAAGDLANWSTGDAGTTPAVGGAMDLAAGAKRVFIAMEHTTRDGATKLLKKCTLPITAPGVVKMLVTDLGLFEITPEGFKLVEYAPGWSPEEIQEQTEAKLIIPDDLKEFRFRS